MYRCFYVSFSVCVCACVSVSASVCVCVCVATKTWNLDSVVSLNSKFQV